MISRDRPAKPGDDERLPDDDNDLQSDDKGLLGDDERLPGDEGLPSRCAYPRLAFLAGFVQKETVAIQTF